MEQYLYKSHDGFVQSYNVYQAQSDCYGRMHPCIVFIFGGGWMRGTMDHFAKQAEQFAKEGITAITPAYRTYKDGENIQTSLLDIFSFLENLGNMADSLCVDRNRIFLSGGSAGGHLAICSVLLNHIKNNLNIRGLVLFNPVLDTSKKGYQSPALLEQPWNPILFSPLHYLYAMGKEEISLPPMLVFHGTADTVMPVDRIRLFCRELMKKNGSVTLVEYENQKHGFFNYREGEDSSYYKDTLKKALDFCNEKLNVMEKNKNQN